MQHFGTPSLPQPSCPAAVSFSQAPRRLPALVRRGIGALGLLLGLLPLAARAQTATFGYTGGSQSYTVPAGTTQVRVVAVGASSGTNNGGTNAIAGAQVTATLNVTPGEVLTVVVGGQSVGKAGGYNGGGPANYGSGGGGGTDLRRPYAAGSTGDPYGGRNALLVAGGGGGSESTTSAQGGPGGQPNGSYGQAGGCSGGAGGGTQTSGGGGYFSGSLGQGGYGGTYNGVGSPGGGGGFYGGGSGYINYCGFFSGTRTSGAGGGSSWTMASATGVSYATPATGDGQLSITSLAPTITGISPTPGVRGQAVTVTGTGLSGVTGVSVNGVAATVASFVNNTATSLTFQVPATAGASGTTSVTTAGGTASVTTFTTVAATPPGNALAFDGSDDYVGFGSPAGLSNLGLGPLTMEAWVYCTNLPAVNSIIRKGGDYNLVLQPGGLLYAEVWSGGTGSPTRPYLQATTAIPQNRWTHVAATWDGTTIKLYVNGVDALGTQSSSPITTSEALQIGRSGVYNQPFNGRLDEVRLYNAALTPANIQADMLSTGSAVPASLKFFLNFDQAANTPGGTNTGQTTLYDQSSSAYAGTLTNFALTGTTSNYLESYALVVPTATAASALSGTGFTANWTAPALGVVDNGYRLDVSTSSTFASVIAGSPFTVASGTSRAVTGLTTGTTYYYRVRADKTSVTGQGAVSNTISVVPCPAPVATAQNVTAALNTSGSATVAATAVNNGSTANCGAAPAGALSVSPGSFGCADAVPATVASALSFNGTTQYVEGTNANLPLGNAARTIEAWVYPTAAGANGIVFNYGTPTTNLRSGILLNSGNLYYVGENNDLRGNIALTVNAWNHVAATYDGSTLRLYVNGVLDVSSTPGAFNTTGTVWRIAQRSYPQTGELLTGGVDEVRVWNVARTAAQIVANKGVGLPGGTPGLVAYYRLNEGSGSTTADATASASAGTLYNAPTWTSSAAPVVNGVPVTLTVTSVDGNTSTAAAVVTVLDNTAPAVANVLPSAPALALANVPEASGYGVLYQVDMPANGSFGSLGAVPYAVNKSATVLPANPARVAYYVELNNGSTTKWVWASMDNFAANLTQLGLPHPTTNPVNWHQSVSNLNVFSNNGGTLVTGSSLGTGRVEMWPSNYDQSNPDGVAGANTTYFDMGDGGQSTSPGHGSFQVHNLTTPQTVFGYNGWGSSVQDGVGIGNQSAPGAGDTDWTFSNNVGSYTVKSLYILVPDPSASIQAATVALGAGGTVTVSPAQVYRGNATDNCGAVTASVSPNTFSCANVGNNPVTVTLSDRYGNTTTQTTVVTVTVPPTPTTTWNGAASSSWTDCANWSYGKVPDAATSVVIPTGQPRYPVLTTGNTYPVLDLTINSGGTLTLNSGTTLQVNGSFANSGTATLSGTVAFVGSAATQTLSNGSGFTTVVVNKPSGTVQLAQNLTINAALTLTSGTLTTTASYQANLGGSASISESDASYVLGKVVVNRTLVPGAAQAFSGLGLTLTPAAGSTAPGATLLTRTTGTALAGAGTSQSILRNFDIQPATNTGLNVTMDFAYFPHELNGIPVANLVLFKSVSGGTPWMPQRGTAAGANVVTKTGITDFSIWTLGNSANPLPVELAEFTAAAHGRTVQLHWSTASEKNSQAFEVERSLSGGSFERIGTVAAAGSSSSPRVYDLLDPLTLLPSYPPTLYYRLRQVDLDGTFSYSPVRSVRLSEAADGPALFPNPTTARTMLTGAQPGTLVQVLDALGRVVASASADAAGTAALTLPAGLATGVYVVRAGTQALRLTVE